MSHQGTAPVQLDLPGQTHVADGPHDQSGMYLMHHAFRRDLASFASAVRRTPLTEPDVWRALAVRWTRFAETLHHHHEAEDTSIWPVLMSHADADGNAEDRATLEAMEAEHAVIDPSLAACHAGFQAMTDHPCADHRDALDRHLTRLRESLAEHLRHEETEALPMIQRTMTDAEYAAVEKAAQSAYPVSAVPFLVPWVLEGLPDDARAAMFAMAGRGYAAVYRLTRPRFQRRERLAFRYATGDAR